PPRPMPTVTPANTDLKALVKEALREVLLERRGYLKTLVAEALEELAADEAQREREAIEQATRDHLMAGINAQA
ncbi:MAG: hypothetical protein AAFU38_17320, partial [Bacteroidota bacterium]